MWNALKSLVVVSMVGSTAIAVEKSSVSVASQDRSEIGSAAKPADRNFADPFFAAPGGAAVIDAGKPGSGPAFGDSILPQCVPFRAERCWLAADYYSAYGQGTLVPALVTSAPNGTGGALGQATALTLFGGRRAFTGSRPGLRATAGLWLTDDARFGVDGTFLYVGNGSETFARTTDANGGSLAQPVTVGLPGTRFAVPVGTLGAGSISARAATAVIGGDANFRYGLTTSERGRLDLLVGYRYVRLRDSVEVASLQSVAGFPQLDTAISDNFRTLNQFHGGQIGLGGTHRIFDRLTLTTKATVALGATISDVDISGSTLSRAGFAPTGLLTAASHTVNTRDRSFAVIPEGTVKLGWDFTDRIRVNAGYSILYWNQVRRAADQIDTTILAAGRPLFPNDVTDYWIQGWTAGLDLRY